MSLRHPTGSNTTGIFRRRAFFPALIIALTQGVLKVPILMTSARARLTISSTSSMACAITGNAPMARSALAVVFITT